MAVLVPSQLEAWGKKVKGKCDSLGSSLVFPANPASTGKEDLHGFA
jgi:hypothetical protein